MGFASQEAVAAESLMTKEKQYFCEQCKPSAHIKLVTATEEGNLDEYIREMHEPIFAAPVQPSRERRAPRDPNRQHIVDAYMEIVISIEAIEALWKTHYSQLPAQSTQDDPERTEKEMRKAVETVLNHIDMDLLNDGFLSICKTRLATEEEQMAEVWKLRRLLTKDFLGDLAGEVEEEEQDLVAFYFGVKIHGKKPKAKGRR